MVKVTRPANPGGITPDSGPAGVGVRGSRGPASPDPPGPDPPGPDPPGPVPLLLSRPSPSCPDPLRPSGLLPSGRESVRLVNARIRAVCIYP